MLACGSEKVRTDCPRIGGSTWGYNVTGKIKEEINTLSQEISRKRGTVGSKEEDNCLPVQRKSNMQQVGYIVGNYWQGHLTWTEEFVLLKMLSSGKTH